MVCFDSRMHGVPVPEVIVKTVYCAVTDNMLPPPLIHTSNPQVEFDDPLYKVKVQMELMVYFPYATVILPEC